MRMRFVNKIICNSVPPRRIAKPIPQENKDNIINEVMETREKVELAMAAMQEEQPKVRKVKKDKSLIERTNDSVTILTEDNRELLKD